MLSKRTNHTRISLEDLRRNFQEVEPGIDETRSNRMKQTDVFIAMMRPVSTLVPQVLIFPPLLKRLHQAI